MINKDMLKRLVIWFWVLMKTGSLPAKPAQEEKHKVILDFARTFNLKILVETGTYRGDTIEATKGGFTKIFSIELDPVLYTTAKARFTGNPQVNILHGDSGIILPQIIRQISEPALFWLDGHWSGNGTAKGEQNTPIIKELKNILDSYRHPSVILVDDARCFVGRHDYPTIREIKMLVKRYNPNLKIQVKRDIIRIFPE